MRGPLAFLAIAGLIAPALPAQAPLAGLEARVSQILKDWNVPGAAVVIVKDGKPVLVKGYGVRKAGEPAPVDARTQFGIASLSKAFTSATVMMLADEGKLRLDDPVVKHLPGFQLKDPYITRELTIRDLLCHRSGLGLGAGDLMTWGGTWPRADVLARMKHLPMAHGLRTTYAYQNNGFIVAGAVVEAVAGKPWESVVTERILRPLGMSQANADIAQQAGLANVATPHSTFQGPLRAISLRSPNHFGPAGALNVCAEEMVPWIQLQLGKGSLNGTRFWSQRASFEMWSPQMLVPNRPPAKDLAPLGTNYAAYGLGWDLRDYRGHRMVSHTGGLDGMTCMLALLPEDNLGIAVLTNAEVPVWRPLIFEIADRFLGVPAFDWSAPSLARLKKGQADVAAMEAQSEADRLKGTRPSLPLASYAGTWRDAWYGDIALAVDGEGFALDMKPSPSFKAKVTHWHLDTWKATFTDRTIPDALLTFQIGPDGKPTGLRMRPFSPGADFSYDYQDLDLRPVP